MNSAIHNALQQYLDTFMDTVAERFEINRDDLNDLWKDTQKKKFSKKHKTTKRKKSSVPSAYILFCQDERAKIKDQHPEMTFAGVAKELGRRWKDASDRVKDHYKKQHNILLEQHQHQQTTAASPSASAPAPDDAASITEEEEDDVMVATNTAPATTQEAVVEQEEEEKPKKPKKPKTVDIPGDITNERERNLWPEFAKMTITELRTQCEHNNLKKSKNRNDMIHALIIHRIALEDGNTQINSDDEDED